MPDHMTLPSPVAGDNRACSALPNPFVFVPVTRRFVLDEKAFLAALAESVPLSSGGVIEQRENLPLMGETPSEFPVMPLFLQRSRP